MPSTKPTSETVPFFCFAVYRLLQRTMTNPAALNEKRIA